MKIHVLAGPTLSEKEILGRLDCVVAGPAAFGDVYRTALNRPLGIAIVDGYFERVPAVWHKEILWAMSEGVHVFGASSMGALRAAELCDFGMVGIGQVFEQFRDGVLEDDDEVAVAHGSAESGYLPCSDAMVNIRATLRRAVDEGVLGATTSDSLARLAKSQFYAERSYASLLELASSAGLPADELARFREWLPLGRVNQKRLDAEALLDHLRQWQATKPNPKRVGYAFEPTDAWQEAARLATDARAIERAGAEVGDDAVLEELKLEGGYAAAHAAAAARGWALEAARRSGFRGDAVAIRAAVEGFRLAQGLTERKDFEQWRQEQRFDEAELTRFFEDEARSAWAAPLTDSLASAQLVSRLRSEGEYGRLARRAEAKAQKLSQLGLASPSISDLGVSEAELWRSYFVDRLGRPEPTDLEAFARRAGFSGVAELRRAALRELCHTRDSR